MHQDFKKLFYKRESKELLGERNRNFWFLCFIFLITFFALGFANGSMDYLKAKMSSPFVKWVSVEIPYTSTGLMHNVQKELLSESTKKDLQIEHVTMHVRMPLLILDHKTKASMQIAARSIAIDDPVLSEIFNNKNFLRGRKFEEEKDIGLVITQSTLEKLNYPDDTPFLLVDIETEKGDLGVPIPVIAIVRDLPGNNKIAFTPHFYKMKAIAAKGNPFNPLTYDLNLNQLIYFLPTEDQKIVDQFSEQVQKYLDGNAPYKNMEPETSITEENKSYIKGYNVNIYFSERPNSYNFITALDQNLNNNSQLGNFKYWRNYDYNLYDNNDNISYDYLSVGLASLDYLRPLKNYLAKEYQLEVDMAQVEALENYNFVTKLTLFVSIALILFSMTSIGLFIFNMLKSHLESIKMNLGTFKAFGLDNPSLEKIYSVMIIGITLIAFLFSFLIALILGHLGIIKLFLWISNNQLEKGQIYFDLWNGTSLLLFLLILIVVYLIIKRAMQQILRRSPGDLVYNRE